MKSPAVAEAPRPREFSNGIPVFTASKRKKGRGKARQRSLVDIKGNVLATYERSTVQGSFGRFHRAESNGEPRGLKQFAMPSTKKKLKAQPKPGKKRLHETKKEDVFHEADLMTEIGMKVHAIHLTARGHAFIETDLFDGSLETLRKRMPADTRVGAARHVLMSLADQLQPLHAKGSVHRDIKSDNVLIKKDGTVQLADPGLLITAEEIKSGRSGTAGTHPYMAPEYFNGTYGRGKADPKADVWALGCLFFEMLGDRWPMARLPKGSQITEGHKEFELVRDAILNNEPVPNTKARWGEYFDVALNRDPIGARVVLEHLLAPSPKGRVNTEYLSGLFSMLKHYGKPLTREDARAAAANGFGRALG